MEHEVDAVLLALIYGSCNAHPGLMAGRAFIPLCLGGLVHVVSHV